MIIEKTWECLWIVTNRSKVLPSVSISRKEALQNTNQHHRRGSGQYSLEVLFITLQSATWIFQTWTDAGYRRWDNKSQFDVKTGVLLIGTGEGTISRSLNPENLNSSLLDMNKILISDTASRQRAKVEIRVFQLLTQNGPSHGIWNMELVELFKKRKQQPMKAKNLLKLRRKGAAFVKTLTPSLRMVRSRM